MSDRSNRHGRGWTGTISVPLVLSPAFVPFPASEATTGPDWGLVRTRDASHVRRCGR